jgi:hypothetical protein
MFVYTFLFICREVQTKIYFLKLNHQELRANENAYIIREREREREKSGNKNASVLLVFHFEMRALLAGVTELSERTNEIYFWAGIRNRSITRCLSLGDGNLFQSQSRNVSLSYF